MDFNSLVLDALKKHRKTIELNNSRWGKKGLFDFKMYLEKRFLYLNLTHRMSMKDKSFSNKTLI